MTNTFTAYPLLTVLLNNIPDSDLIGFQGGIKEYYIELTRRDILQAVPASDLMRARIVNAKYDEKGTLVLSLTHQYEIYERRFYSLTQDYYRLNIAPFLYQHPGYLHKDNMDVHTRSVLISKERKALNAAGFKYFDYFTGFVPSTVEEDEKE